MNNRTIQLLALIVGVLAVAMFMLDSGDSGDQPGAGEVLFPDMRAVANDIEKVTVTRVGQPVLNVVRADGSWVVPDRGNYRADMGIVRDVLVAMTDAAIVETKTANPDLHARLGVDAPNSDLSKGISVEASTSDTSFALIFGNVAQQNFRYARIAGEDQSWLIDQNPDIPADAGAWLDADIVDIDSNSVRSVTITHPDGEIITISKALETDPNFVVAEVPEGRELSYSTVANGIGGALNDLDLDDVREAAAFTESVDARFTTFDNVIVDASVTTDEAGKWLALDVHVLADTALDGATDWTAIRARVNGWQFRIADYKANLFTRRWDDILKAEEPAGE